MFRSQSSGQNLNVVVIDALDTKVTPKMNMDLCRAFTPEEMEITLFQMHLSKSRGPNGMPSYFPKNIGLL